MATQHGASDGHARSTPDKATLSNALQTAGEPNSSASIGIDWPVASSSGPQQTVKVLKQSTVNTQAMKLYAEESEIDWRSLVDERLLREKKSAKFRLDTRRAVVKEHWEKLDHGKQERYIEQARTTLENQSRVEEVEKQVCSHLSLTIIN